MRLLATCFIAAIAAIWLGFGAWQLLPLDITKQWYFLPAGASTALGAFVAYLGFAELIDNLLEKYWP